MQIAESKALQGWSPRPPSTTNSGHDGMVSKKYATDGIATDVCVRTQNVLKLLIILECSIILEVDAFGFESRLLNRPLNV